MGRITLERIAYHEAGHAFMAFYQRCTCRHASIIPDEKDNSLGHILNGKRARVEYDRISPSSKDRLQIEKYILVAYAGNAAERLLTRRKVSDGSHKDFQDAYDYVSLLIQDEEEVYAYLKWLQLRAENILSIRYNWFAVEVLAKELLKRKYIGGKQVRQIIRQAWIDSCPMPSC